MQQQLPSRQEVFLNIKAITVAKIVGIILLMITGFHFLGKIIPVFLILTASAFFAVALNPLISKITRWVRIKNRSIATGIAFAGVVFLLGSFLTVVVPPVASRISQTVLDLPGSITRFMEKDNFLAESLKRYEVQTDVQELADNIATYFPENIDSLISIFKAVPSGLVSIPAAVILILAFTFFILNSAPKFWKQIQQAVSKERLVHWQRLGSEMQTVVIGYIGVQFLLSLIAGLMAFLAMYALQVENALALAGVISLCNLIPLVGPLVGSAIVVLLVVFVDFNAALALAAYFFLYQQLENVTLQPWLQSQYTNLTTMQVLLAVLIGGYAAGVAGALLSIPLAACLKVLLMDYHRRNPGWFDKEKYSKFL